MNESQNQRFLVLGDARSGTTWLSSLLKSNTNIEEYKIGTISTEFHELLNISYMFKAYKYSRKEFIEFFQDPKISLNKNSNKLLFTKLLYSDFERISHNQIFLEDLELFAKQAKELVQRGTMKRSNYLDILKFQNMILTSKTLQKQVRTLGLNLLDESNLKIIHIVRKNKLEKIVSGLLTNMSLEWKQNQLPKNISQINSTAFTLSTYSCEHNFKHLAKNELLIREELKNYKCMEITYENLCNNPVSTLEGIQEYLEIEKQNLTSKMYKQNSKDLRKIIKNYDELKSYFAGSKWSEYFKE